jgi:hypothetical protein
MQRAYLKNDGRQCTECGQNCPVQTLTHGARPFGAERAGAQGGYRCTSGAAKAPKELGAAEWHRALSRPAAAGGGASASNRKEAALRAAGLYTTRGRKGVTGEK